MAERVSKTRAIFKSKITNKQRGAFGTSTTPTIPFPQNFFQVSNTLMEYNTSSSILHPIIPVGADDYIWERRTDLKGIIQI